VYVLDDILVVCMCLMI